MLKNKTEKLKEKTKPKQTEQNKQEIIMFGGCHRMVVCFKVSSRISYKDANLDDLDDGLTLLFSMFFTIYI